MSKIILFLSLFINLISYILSPNLVYAQVDKPNFDKPNKVFWSDRCAPTINGVQVATIQGLECLFARVLTVVTYIAGISFFFMFIINGFKYIFSSSDQKKLAEINSSITLAVIGLAGVIISWLIIKFINDFFGVNITIFKIPGGI